MLQNLEETSAEKLICRRDTAAQRWAGSGSGFGSSARVLNATQNLWANKYLCLITREEEEEEMQSITLGGFSSKLWFPDDHIGLLPRCPVDPLQVFCKKLQSYIRTHTDTNDAEEMRCWV
jgi:hypothetical protein